MFPAFGTSCALAEDAGFRRPGPPDLVGSERRRAPYVTLQSAAPSNTTFASSQVRPDFERLYGSGSESMSEWAPCVVGTLEGVFGPGSGIAFSLIDIPSRRPIFLESGGAMRAKLPGEVSGALFHLEASTLEQMYTRPGPVRFSREKTPAQGEPNLMQIFCEAGAADALGVTSVIDERLGLAAFAMLPRPPRLSHHEQRRLAQLALHLESATRLRLRSANIVGRVTLGGNLELREAEAPMVWGGLVAGRLGLAEQMGREGERSYAIYENAPHHVAPRRLTPQEARVLGECARGATNKEVAFTLGISQPAVSAALRWTALKLGVTCTRHLLILASRLKSTPRSLTLAALSPAEAAVASLLAQGHSNARIALERRSSVCTVRNQVSAILRKSGAPSRRALLSAPA